ncbi:portal protein [Pullulanibacillus camelliae]|uniref:Portal protein n=1 Tax=Pullulanibacillus camelliae TaxID=1707096 RepID=A0A8J3DX79_9BACL|nr:phage portal protein [Pullulanibacillus camelliae]GGE47720.1 portal protein [Pullulanibacillus camelliae]
MFKSIIQKVRGWMYRMGLIKGIKSLSDHKNITESDEHYNRIDIWNALYKGYYEDFHKIRYHTVDGEKTRRMNTLNMPKIVSQEMAALVFNEKCQINISDEELSNNIADVFKMNHFYKQLQRYLEYGFAHGGMAIKVYADDKGVRIGYATADCFVPVSNTSDEITEGVFVSESVKGKKYYTLLEWHTWEGTEYIVTNELYQSDSKIDLGIKVPLETLYPDIEEEVRVKNLSRPLFVYIKPNTANNFDTQSPLGISLYANSLDTLKSLDTAFDSFNREFRLGKKRILVPSSAIKTVLDPETQQMVRYFDANDEAYQSFNMGMDADAIKDISVELRVSEHISAINAFLNLLAMQVGFSAGTFTFDGQGVKTATEVVSENSKTFRTKNSHETLVEEGLKELIISICEVAHLYGFFEAPDDYEVAIDFDDSIAEDRKQNADYYSGLVGQGLMPKVRAIMRIFDLPEDEARRWFDEINQETATATASQVDMFGIGNQSGDD